MKSLKKVIALAAIALCSVQVHAELVIDQFTTAQAVQDLSSNSPANTSNGAITDTIALTAAETGLGPGTIYRTLVADKFGLGGDPTQGVRMNVSTTTNRLGFSQDADNWGQGRAIWSGEVGGGAGTGILDLTTLNPASSFAFTYRSDGELRVRVLITDTDNNTVSEDILTNDTNGLFENGSIALGAFDFSSFTSTDIGRIEIFINVDSTAATADIDLTFSRITNVPEPGSLALAGLALTGVALRRRRKVELVAA